jgi:hypothetical protein
MYTDLIIICKPVGLSRPHEASLRIMSNSFLLEQITSLLQNPLSWRARVPFP